MQIWFDMDGTLADLYGVQNWLDMLRDFNPQPYATATPLVNMSSLARILHRLQREGYEIGIISWLSKTSTPDYDIAVTSAKISWLHKHLPSVQFDHIDIVPYGTPKHQGRSGVLFDDEQKNRDDWQGVAYNVENIIAVLRTF